MRKITESGRGTQLAKVDIKHAYHNVPVHPDDRPYDVGREGVCGHRSAIWPKISGQIFFIIV